jgi:phosphoribosylaminoimidazole-succinocarboxamide synthase
VLTDITELRALVRAAAAHAIDGPPPPLEAILRGATVDQVVLSGGDAGLLFTDRVRVLGHDAGLLPLTGQARCLTVARWLAQLADSIAVPRWSQEGPNLLRVEPCEPLPLLFEVRGYLTGVAQSSLYGRYLRGERAIEGQKLPEGLDRYGKLPEPVVLVSGDEPPPEGATDLARALFTAAAAIVEPRGLLLAEAAIALGRRPDGVLVPAGELLTLDTARFWFEATYEPAVARSLEPSGYDAEYLRRHLADRGFFGGGPFPSIDERVRTEAAALYLEATETLLGAPLGRLLGDDKAPGARSAGADAS